MMGIQARVSALMAICLIVCGHTADAFPSLWASLSADMANTQDTCPQPHIAYGQHGDPQPDPSITFAVTQGGTAVQAYCPGMVLLVTVNFVNSRQAFLTSSIGTFGSTKNSLTCSGAGMYSSLASKSISATLTIPCGVSGDLMLKVTSATGMFANYQQSSLTMPASSSCSLCGASTETTIAKSQAQSGAVSSTYPVQATAALPTPVPVPHPVPNPPSPSPPAPHPPAPSPPRPTPAVASSPPPPSPLAVAVSSTPATSPVTAVAGAVASAAAPTATLRSSSPAVSSASPAMSAQSPAAAAVTVPGKAVAASGSVGPLMSVVDASEARIAARKAAAAERVSGNYTSPFVKALSGPASTTGKSNVTSSYFDDYGLEDPVFNATGPVAVSQLVFSNVSTATNGDIMANIVGQVVRISDLTSAILSTPAILAQLSSQAANLVQTFDRSGLAARGLSPTLEQALSPSTDVTQLLNLLQSYYAENMNSSGGNHTSSVSLQQSAPADSNTVTGINNAVTPNGNSTTLVPTHTTTQPYLVSTNSSTAPAVSVPGLVSVPAIAPAVAVSPARAVTLPPYSSSASTLVSPVSVTVIATAVAVGSLVWGLF